MNRLMGTETEFGISVPGRPQADSRITSAQVVKAGRSLNGQGRTRWDYEGENPLRDARGWEVPREGAHRDLLTDEEAGRVDVVLPNGARFYVDHAHPEYSGPEVTNPRDAVLHDKVGDWVAGAAARAAAPGQPPILLFKNNTDNKGSSYGTHENYLMPRSTEFGDIVTELTPFFVSRQVVTGAGRVGIGQDGHTPGFQISQRADFFETEVGLETTHRRPIINTRDEPHADAAKYRRLHVIIGDANLSEISGYLKLGTTSLVLSMIEDGWLRGSGVDLSVENPVGSLHAVSHDPTLKHLVRLRDGRRMTGVDLQMAYLDQVHAHVDDRYGRDADGQTKDVLQRWGSTLDRLKRDPMSLARELDWVAKLQILEGNRARAGLSWDHPKLQLIDLQYADMRPEKGLYHRRVAAGHMERLFTDEEIRRAVDQPPTDTRAFFRGECVKRYPGELVKASWSSVVFDVGSERLKRVQTLEPQRGTEARVGTLFASNPTAGELVATLTGAPPPPPPRPKQRQMRRGRTRR